MPHIAGMEAARLAAAQNAVIRMLTANLNRARAYGGGEVPRPIVQRRQTRGRLRDGADRLQTLRAFDLRLNRDRPIALLFGFKLIEQGVKEANILCPVGFGQHQRVQPRPRPLDDRQRVAQRKRRVQGVDAHDDAFIAPVDGLNPGADIGARGDLAVNRRRILKVEHDDVSRARGGFFKQRWPNGRHRKQATLADRGVHRGLRVLGSNSRTYSSSKTT